jgi:hypothetical protein
MPGSGGVPLESLSFAISACCFTLWGVMLAGRGISRLSARNAGPDPWLEHLLRGAFAEFDRELRKIVPRLYGDSDGELRGRANRTAWLAALYPRDL